MADLDLIAAGTPVRTITENPATVFEWTKEGRAQKKWGVTGEVVTHHNSHGLCYDVLHADGTQACYDPSELELS
jgi:hypothetical protein